MGIWGLGRREFGSPCVWQKEKKTGFEKKIGISPMEKGYPCVWQNLLGIWQITCGKYGEISQSKIPSLNPFIIGGIVQISRAGEIPFAARQQRPLYQFLTRVGEEGHLSKFRW